MPAGCAWPCCAGVQQQGATRAYVQVLSENSGAIMLYHSLGFRLHHHHRYVDARSLTARTL